MGTKDKYNRGQFKKLSAETHNKVNEKDLHTSRIPVTVTSSNIHQIGGLAAEQGF